MTASVLHIVIGFWILLSPWFLGWSGIPVIMWSNLLSGVFVIVLGVWQIFGGERINEPKGPPIKSK